MKILFWTVVLVAFAWWIGKRKLGATNDLVAHFQEQNALKDIGDVANGADYISANNWPLSEIGQTPFAGIHIDPFNTRNPFTAARDLTLGQAYPSDAQPPFMLW